MPSETAIGQETSSGTPSRPDLEIEVTTPPPIFVVGDRADRGRLATLLDGRDGISFAPHSSLLTDLAGAARHNWPDLCRYGYPEQYWLARVAGFFDALQTEYAASRRLTRWGATIDQSALALVDRLFPRCQVVWVVAERRPPWAGKAAGALGPDRCYDLRADELARRPDSAVAAVLSFLDPLVEARRRP